MANKTANRQPMQSVATLERVILNYSGTAPTFNEPVALRLVVDTDGATKYFTDADGAKSIRFSNQTETTRYFVGMKLDYFGTAGIELLQDETGVKFINLTPTPNTFKVSGAVKSASL